MTTVPNDRKSLLNEMHQLQTAMDEHRYWMRKWRDVAIERDLRANDVSAENDLLYVSLDMTRRELSQAQWAVISMAAGSARQVFLGSGRRGK